ncbi:MAG: glycosyltransferase family 1 protein [Candidatus Buchananbacteria bacterium]|jgi:glycosyltransferase involved in cell wall biosynthesis
MSRIGIDARLFGTKHGGIGRYTVELIKNLELQDKSNKYFIFFAKDNFDEYSPSIDNFKKVHADFKVYGVFEQLLYPFLLYKYNLDLMHFAHFNAPILYGKKYIITIHDLIISHYPSSRATTLNPLLYKIKLGAYHFLINAVAKRAKKIIAVSQYTKNDIVKFLNVKSEKVSVIYEGVDLPKGDAAADVSILDKLGIKGDYLVYVGSAYPHKNLEKLIEAFELLNKDYPDLQLVLVGKKNFFYKRLEEFAMNNVSPRALERIIFAGYQADENVARLYQQAKLYVFPSLIEGFGLPPLEAQSYGLPVVSSDRSCLPEILGDSAIYFDPENTADMANKIKLALTDDTLRSKLTAKGYENVKKYSWSKMAVEIIDIYNKNLN